MTPADWFEVLNGMAGLITGGLLVLGIYLNF